MVNFKKYSNGFSLIELLVVISIIGVLSAVLMVNFVGTRERSRDAQKIQNLNSLKNALRLYYNDNQRYPTNAELRGVGFSGYMANIGDTSFVYTQPNGTDSFKITIGLEVGAGDDDENSQVSCGLTPTPGVYSVCAN